LIDLKTQISTSSLIQQLLTNRWEKTASECRTQHGE